MLHQNCASLLVTGNPCVLAPDLSKWLQVVAAMPVADRRILLPRRWKYWQTQGTARAAVNALALSRVAPLSARCHPAA